MIFRQRAAMTEQLSLAGLNPASQPTDRLFFGVIPDAPATAETTQLVQHLRREHGLSGRSLATDHFHVTLCHVGDYVGLPAGIVAAAREAVTTLAMQSFEVTFDHAGSFSGKPRNLPFVLLGNDGVAALIAFQRVLFEALKRVGLTRRAEPSFTPHMTLLYDDRSIAMRPIEPLSWIVREFVLVHSLLGQTRHIPLGRWSLWG